MVDECPPPMQEPEGEPGDFCRQYQRYDNFSYFRLKRSRFIILKGNPEGRTGCGFQALKNPPLGFVWLSLVMQ